MSQWLVQSINSLPYQYVLTFKTCVSKSNSLTQTKYHVSAWVKSEESDSNRYTRPYLILDEMVLMS